MSKYTFSIPLSFDYNSIDKLYEANKTFKKSKITTFYNCIPSYLNTNLQFEQFRSVEDENVKSLDDFLNLVKYAKSKGFDFIYILNSPEILNEQEFNHKIKNFEKILPRVVENGITKFRIASVQLMEYFTKHHPDLDMYISTSLEYGDVSQYLYLFNKFPNIKQFVPSYELNRNIEVIKMLNENIDVDMEIMVNEGCLPGCPFRYNHNLSLREKYLPNVTFENPFFNSSLNTSCDIQFARHFFENLIFSNVIYPWELEQYSQMTGVTNFKLVGRNTTIPGEIVQIHIDWINGVENIENILDKPVFRFNYYTICDSFKYDYIKVSDVIDMFPGINHFEKYGKYCQTKCGVECRICYDAAGKMLEKFPIAKFRKGKK